jgi:manganese efflux pump family protein
MKWVALITWVLTAGGGFVMLGLWLKNGGMQQSELPGDRIRSARILSHFGLAATGLVLWIVYLATDSEALAWIAFALLAVVAVLGFSMLAIWLRQRAHQPALAGAGAPVRDASPPEQHFPTPIVALHGLLAAATLVLVLLVAAGVGGS